MCRSEQDARSRQEVLPVCFKSLGWRSFRGGPCKAVPEWVSPQSRRLPAPLVLAGHNETTWKILETAFNEIHTKNASQLSFEELYRNAYKIVLKKKGDELYQRVAQFEADWLSNKVRSTIVRHLTHPLLMLTDGAGRSLSTSAERKAAGESFLRALKQAWEDHQVCMGMLTDVLMYMVSEATALA